jgi:predicted nucleic acid-binding protein
MIVDTSVWIDYFRGRRSAAVVLLEQQIDAGLPLYLTPAVLQECLQGARSDAHFAQMDEILSALPCLGERDVLPLAREAAQLYRQCRAQGVTPRSHVDCLIAATALHYGQYLLHHDRDYLEMARIVPLQCAAPDFHQH